MEVKKTVTCFLFLWGCFVSWSQELTPTPQEALVTFKVTDYNLIPEEAAAIEITGKDTSLVKKGTTDVDGIFQMLLPKGKKYKIKVRKFDEDFIFDRLLAIPAVEGKLKLDHGLQIRIITQYLRVYTLDHVFFDSGKWNIKDESRPDLDRLADTLRKNLKMKIEIAGHTDNVGDHAVNVKLSQQRADAVVVYLTKKGIAANRILAKGYGETAPIAENTTEKGKQQNRRTEVRIITE